MWSNDVKCHELKPLILPFFLRNTNASMFCYLFQVIDRIRDTYTRPYHSIIFTLHILEMNSIRVKLKFKM
jgi:hypothetical protein